MTQPAISNDPRCPRCSNRITVGERYCSRCGNALAAAPPPLPPRPTPVAQPPVAQSSVASQQTYPAGRRHWPLLAMAFGLALPGAGQAYNGKVFRAFVVALVAAALACWIVAKQQFTPIQLGIFVGWQILMAITAWLTARGIVHRGGRFAKGGLLWVFLQGWLVASLGVAVMIGLTIAGVLR